ncbi:site-specific integrase [Mesorhizobium sp. CN2-181]|uniref:tyrosine-type recombinase/integrase n=1 Tax=Mesorhizobium yinganensis TaxID=3157707 RepID=UPI0032B87283
MRRRPAKILRPGELRTLLKAAGRARHPERNVVIVLLSVRAGLRACEIASLQWGMVLTPKRKINHVIELPDWAAKKGSGRRVPMHRDLRKALARLAAVDGQDGPVVMSERGRAMTARTVVNWFSRMYALCDLDGCSSHSGRRTFITNAARLVYWAGGSLRDVQQLAGHQSLKTTQAYIDGDTDAQRRLVRLL